MWNFFSSVSVFITLMRNIHLLEGIDGTNIDNKIVLCDASLFQCTNNNNIKYIWNNHIHMYFFIFRNSANYLYNTYKDIQYLHAAI